LKPEEIAPTLAALPRGARVTVSVDIDDWRRACEARNGGPEYAGASDVAQLLGFSARYWATRAKAGKIPGAVQDAARRWRLPVAACREHIRDMSNAPAPRSSRALAIVRGKARVPNKVAP